MLYSVDIYIVKYKFKFHEISLSGINLAFFVLQNANQSAIRLKN